MKLLTINEVQALIIETLGLSQASINLDSVEAVSAIVRKAAELHCPCSRSTLSKVVRDSLSGLIDDKKIPVLVENTLESLISYGDFHELRLTTDESEDNDAPRLYPTPPSFIQRKNGNALIIGVFSGPYNWIFPQLRQRITSRGHARIMAADKNEDLRSSLRELGMHELLESNWLDLPPEDSPQEHIQRFDAVLENSNSDAFIPDLEILDPTQPTNFYRGRWAKVSRQNGRFIVRRPQSFGAKVWCYAELLQGRIKKIIDFPALELKRRGFDEAWRLQSAIDAKNKTPQIFKLFLSSEVGRIEFYSPLPMWAQRRLDTIGKAVHFEGCLTAYEMALSEIDQETAFLKKYLWLNEDKG